MSHYGKVTKISIWSFENTINVFFLEELEKEFAIEKQ